MLASQIKDFSKKSVSKRPSKFYLFCHRFFIDFGSVLASNMELSWGARWLKIRKNGSKNLGRCLPKSGSENDAISTSILERLGSAFGGQDGPKTSNFRGVRVWFCGFFDDFSNVLTYYGHVFSCSCWGGYAPPDPPAPDLVFVFLGKFIIQFANLNQELAEDNAEKKTST